MANSKKNGFTLIELVVVIAIIGVLAALLVPAMLGYIKKSRRTSDISSAKRIYDSVMTTIADNDDAEEALTAQSAKQMQVTVGSDTYDLCIACSKDGVKHGGGNDSLWNGASTQTEPFQDSLNSVVGKLNTPVKYTKSEEGKKLNRWFICYHDDDHSQIEIWVGDGTANEPEYRMYPDRDSKYA
ncbi:MAG: type II secretion system protein [Ruminococcus sp.]|uniref:type II secretion system protein n=1 Tax=Ruminococcus sp. TaxID=41978 RepID=UPI001B097DBD|nr:type II secretion system protein [Ruminococcus sp.]MBO7474414.1 type II secretion system protein [Ruminococcus sp.]